MFVQAKKATHPERNTSSNRPMLSSELAVNARQPRFNSLNVHSFKNMARYIQSLHEKGIISEELFLELLANACSIFVENEVERVLEDAFSSKISIEDYLVKGVRMLRKSTASGYSTQ